MLTSAWLLWAPSLHAQAASSGQAGTLFSKDNQASIDQKVSLLRQDLRSQKKQLIAASFELTDRKLRNSGLCTINTERSWANRG